ncbi:hypothetical protein PR048_007938 [Dryococelus australis]|uniref:Uncharacterized protein n=1 Tax=Dryococelus australis TaxID=614101 RepID=A0ABQ9HVN9_9NEOP|nr:hypothetical protein PR048_007938 [Dryococelus australis]
MGLPLLDYLSDARVPLAPTLHGHQWCKYARESVDAWNRFRYSSMKAGNTTKLAMEKISVATVVPRVTSVKTSVSGAAVAGWLACSHPTKANRVQYPAGSLPDFRMWESCRTMPLVGGFYRGSPVSHALAFRRCSILSSITLIGSQELAVKSSPNFFAHSLQSSDILRHYNCVTSNTIEINVISLDCVHDNYASVPLSIRHTCARCGWGPAATWCSFWAWTEKFLGSISRDPDVLAS